MDKIAPLSQVRSSLSGIISKLQSDHKRVIVTAHGKPAAVIISLEELETLETSADTKLLSSLRRALEDVKTGRLVSSKSIHKKSRRRK